MWITFSRRWLIIDYRHRYSLRWISWKIRHALGLLGEVPERVRAGEDFAALARTMSQDTFSGQRGGDLDPGEATVAVGLVDPRRVERDRSVEGDVGEPQAAPGEARGGRTLGEETTEGGQRDRRDDAARHHAFRSARTGEP